jgi:hypothetical protein
VNNSVPNTRNQHHAIGAKPTRNQQDAVPALSYEPGGRRFESCRARYIASFHPLTAIDVLRDRLGDLLVRIAGTPTLSDLVLPSIPFLQKRL